MDPLDYDSCAQFLARLDQDAESITISDDPSPAPRQHRPHSHNTTSSSSAAASPQTGDSSSNSPHSPYNSANSPPGLSSGSVTSHSPESLKFDYDYDYADPSAFFDTIVANGDGNNAWDSLMQTDPDQPVVSPMSDYIKIESDNPSPGYFNQGPPQQQQPQTTISPGNSLLDPTVQTALEGNFMFGKEGDGLFDFPGIEQNQNEEFAPMGWRGQQRDDFSGLNWPQQQQQQQQPQRQQPQQQQQQRRQSQLPQQRSQPQPGSPLRHSMSPPSSHSHRSTTSPDSHSDNENAPAPRPKKRKTSTTDVNDNEPSSGSASTGGRKQPKKTAHNMIEKRYRTNLNDKIAALRDSVPSLRVMAGTSKLGEDDEEEDLEGLAPAHKLNKATVLAKATEYIRHLEKRTKRLQDENEQLKNRLSAFEKLATMGGSMSQGHPGNGRGGAAGGPGGGLMSRLMVGSLAGLMVAGGLSSHEDSGSRQLFALPVSLLEMFGVPASPSVIAGNQIFWMVFKLLLVIMAVVYVIVPAYFDSKPEPSVPLKSSADAQSDLSAVPSLASPLDVRRKAWLTAIQTVWVPRHSVGLELAALGLKALKLALRKAIGWQHYAFLTGMTEDHEIARVKAWTIALDAQLAGGDEDINHSRLVLTWMASLTLPATPARLMLNVMHIRVLFSDFGPTTEQLLAHRLANYYWAAARSQQAEANETDRLPDHLARLLELDHAIVFDPRIVRAAHNLAYNRRSENGASTELVAITEDSSVRSPLDALAAWYSSVILQRVFLLALKNRPSLQSRILSDLDVALRVAPPGSAAHLRALAAKAIIVSGEVEQQDDALKTLVTALQDVPVAPSAVSQQAVRSGSSSVDLRVSVRCAMASALLRSGRKEEAKRLFSGLDYRRGWPGLGLLGFLAIWKTLGVFTQAAATAEKIDAEQKATKSVKEEEEDEAEKEAGEEALAAAAGLLRIWIGSGKEARRVGVGREDCRRIVEFCLDVQKKLAGLEPEGPVVEDDGYVSGSAGRR